MRNQIELAGDLFSEDNIMDASVFMAQSVDGSELQVDTLSAKLELGSEAHKKFVPKGSTGYRTSDNKALMVGPVIRVMIGDPSKYKYGSPVYLKRDGKLLGKFYMSKLTRVGSTRYKVDCVSGMGLLDKTFHYGGVYGMRVDQSSGQVLQTPPTAHELIDEVIGGVIPYTVDTEYDGVLVYGWLPKATRRENLHQILFAIGAFVSSDEKGDPLITPFKNNAYQEIPEDRVFMGGDVKYSEGVTQVSVSEHSFALARDAGEPITLFDGQISAEQVLTPKGKTVTGGIVLFREPCDAKSLVATGCTILESDVNYAVLTATGAAKLTGQPYVHTIRQVNRPEAVAKSTGIEETEHKITVNNATLVSFANSEKVADRIFSYYNSAKTIKTDIVVQTERPGDPVKMKDPFGDVTNGIIKSMDTDLSGLLRAEVEIVADYQPEGPGNLYTHADVIEQNGTWVVPDGVEKIRVILIGGGQGGYAGNAGEDSPDVNESTETNCVTNSCTSYIGINVDEACRFAKGGLPGAPGQGGKIYPVTMRVTPGQTLSVHIGAGGNGQIFGSTTEPGAGDPTTIDQYTSEKGTPANAGFYEQITGKIFGRPGGVGIPGGFGVHTEKLESGGTTVAYPPDIVVDGVTYTHGANGKGKSDDAGRYDTNNGSFHYNSSGAFGGGPAYGGNGLNGADGYGGFRYAVEPQEGTQYRGVSVTAARPGGGANALPPKDAIGIGTGGTGGNGGGGSGSYGWPVVGSNTYKKGIPPGEIIFKKKPPTKGGNGSDGGKGAPGGAIIYY